MTCMSVIKNSEKVKEGKEVHVCIYTCMTLKEIL